MPNYATRVGSARLNADEAGFASVESPSEAVWNAIGEQANRCRQGQPDILNVNSTGSAGLANQWQQRLNGKFFNSHIVPLPQHSSSSENEVPTLPVMFAQSPDPGGKGTASSAADWLELGADKRAPIFQFVHPVSLERGCYKREVSLIEMLKREDPQGRIYEVIEIPGSVEQGLAGLPSDCRHFRVRKRASGNDARGEWTDIVLLASRLRSGVMPASNIEAAATSIATVMQQHLPSIDGMPIFMSYGGFGRSSCVGLYLTIQEQIQCNPDLTLEQCLSMLEDFVIQGKAHRGRQFVPDHAQYKELKAAIEIVWRKLQTESATLSHSEEQIEELEEINLQPPPLLPSESLLARQVSFAERQESPPNSDSSFISGHFEQASAAQSGFTPLTLNIVANRDVDPAPLQASHFGIDLTSGAPHKVGIELQLNASALKMQLPRQLSSATARSDKLRGMVVLGAVGDALGRSTEFLSPSHRAVWVAWLRKHPAKWLPLVPSEFQDACRNWLYESDEVSVAGKQFPIESYLPLQFRLPEIKGVDKASAVGGFTYERNKLYGLSDKEFEKLLDERFARCNGSDALRQSLLLSSSNTVLGCPTDDTQQSVLVLKSHIQASAAPVAQLPLVAHAQRGETLSGAPLFAALLTAEKDQHRDTHWGFGTQAAASNLQARRAQISTAWLESSGSGCGNGSLMRIAPCLLPVLKSSDPLSNKEAVRWRREILEIGHVTHHDALCQAVNLAFMELLAVFSSVDSSAGSALTVAEHARAKLRARFDATQTAAGINSDAVVSRFMKHRIQELLPQASANTALLWLSESLTFISEGYDRHRCGTLLAETQTHPRSSKPARPLHVHQALEILNASPHARGERGVGSGYLPSTVASVCYILDHFLSDPTAALLEATNFTVDNDTIASIVGNALGALYGEMALRGTAEQIPPLVPSAWLSNLSERWYHPLYGNAGTHRPEAQASPAEESLPSLLDRTELLLSAVPT